MAGRRLAAALLAAAGCLAAWPALAAGGPRFSAAAFSRVGRAPARMVAADLNGDGTVDLATTDFGSSTVSVLLGVGDGNFRSRIRLRAPRYPVGIAAVDVNGDGTPDLVTASRDRRGSITVWLNRGAGRFMRLARYRVGPDAYAVAAGDVNGDRMTDLVTAQERRQDFSVLLGVGGGRFTRPRLYRGPGASDVELSDLNGDGRQDAVLAAEYNGSVAVRLGHGDGSFTPPRKYKLPTLSSDDGFDESDADPFDVTVADFNADGRVDVAAANYEQGTVSVLLGNGDGTLAAAVSYSMTDDAYVDAVVAADFDHDGILDIAAPSGSGPALRRGRGDGTFLDEQPFGRYWTSQAGATGDFNGDGWADLAFVEACTEEGEECFADRALVFLNWTQQPAPPCAVPDVTSVAYYQLSLRRAVKDIRSNGCRLGRVRRRHSRHIHRGNVLSQRPRPGTVLPSLARVDLVVSRGRAR